VIVAVAADHAGYSLKEALVPRLREAGHEVLDLGVHAPQPADYPDLAQAVGGVLTSGKAARGILVCGSGVGACVAANKLAGVRAGLCHDSFSARQGVEDDDMNVLCLGARVIGPELAYSLVQIFLAARFSGAERHLRRLAKVRAIEDRCGTCD